MNLALTLAVTLLTLWTQGNANPPPILSLQSFSIRLPQALPAQEKGPGLGEQGASLLAQMVKNLLANAGDLGSIPGSGRSPGEGNGNPFQYSCLENPMDRGNWWATVYGFSKSWTGLSY